MVHYTEHHPLQSREKQSNLTVYCDSRDCKKEINLGGMHIPYLQEPHLLPKPDEPNKFEPMKFLSGLSDGLLLMREKKHAHLVASISWKIAKPEVNKIT